MFYLCHRRTSQKSANAPVRTDTLAARLLQVAVLPFCAAPVKAALKSRSNPVNYSRAMLKKRLRLRSLEVEQVMKGGRSGRSAHLQVKFIAGTGPFRSAAVVPKSLARKATARNTLRRALYRSIALTNTTLKGNAVFFVRVVPKQKPAAVFTEELGSLIASLSSKLS